MDDKEDFFSVYGDTSRIRPEDLDLSDIDEIEIEDADLEELESRTQKIINDLESEQYYSSDKSEKIQSEVNSKKKKKEKKKKNKQKKDFVGKIKKEAEHKKRERKIRQSGLAPLDENGEKIKTEAEVKADVKRNNLMLVGVFSILLLFVSMISIGVYAFVNSDRSVSVQNENQGNSHYPVSFVSRISDVCVNKNGIAVINGMNFSFFDKNAKQIDDTHLNYTDPKMVKSEKYILVYDADGSNFRVYGKAGMLRNDETVGNTIIIGGYINNSGSFLLFTRPRISSAYATYVNYYSSYRTDKPVRWGSKDYVVKGAITSDGKNILVCGINTKAMDLFTNLYILSSKELGEGKGESQLSMECPAVPVDCVVLGNKRIIVNFNDMRLSYSPYAGNSASVMVDYPGELVKTASDKNGNTAILTRTKDMHKLKLSVYNSRNIILFEKNIKDDVNDIAINGQNVYVLTDKKLILVRKDKDNETLDKYDILRNRLEIFGKEIYNYSSDKLFRY